ncbi:MAG: formylglycine-generating enzyme family protein [Kiritimatiellia bacterium]
MGEQKACCMPGEKRCECDDVEEPGFVRTTKGSCENMVRLRGGPFLMGTADKIGFADDGEGPVRKVTIRGFYMDIHAVTNAAFAQFVAATGYRTDAEKFGYSYVFHVFVEPRLRAELLMLGRQLAGLEWWFHVEGADWQHPEGPDSAIGTDRMEHPVVHISWRDAMAYCDWAGKRLPTEAEFEYAARGGLVQKRYVWGNTFMPGGKHMCNIWQGEFPVHNTAEDGYVGTAPAKHYAPNGYGLYHMAGNVWEWVFDRWSPDFHIKGPRLNPIGPPEGDRRVMRGGSYLCHDSYCNRYRVAARSGNTPDSSTGNMGFRCVRDL